MELHVFDFDGTLFRSPMPPDWWKQKVRKTWWVNSDSLNRPCVPDRPDASWWINSTVADAKKSMSDPDVVTILCTGRPDGTGNFRYRIPELLSQRGLRFDGVFLNDTGAEGVATFKVNVIGEYLRKFPEIEVVQVWEDRAHHLSSFESFVNQKGRRCITHLVHETPKEPLCTPEMYAEGAGDPYGHDPASRVASRWLELEEMRYFANAGYNEWLAMLPKDDWSAEYARAIPVRWDAEKKTWLEWDAEKKEWVENLTPPENSGISKP